jgi:Ca-activated chloride channel family protein
MVLGLGTLEDRSEARLALAGGELQILDDHGNTRGICPLQHTEMEANVSGYVSRVRVRQTFSNPLTTKIEAIYVFPLPQNAAVDDMVMTVGDRRIIGQITQRDAARAIYEAARAAGHVTSLLEQERPNIFTQSVANIDPGAQVVIEISYVETLTFVDGMFELVLPMVVGPRFIPGTPMEKQGTGWAPDTSQVPDGSRISPPVAPPGTRAGHDIRVTVHLEAGTEIADIVSSLHAVDVTHHGPGRATVTLANQAVLANKDFILRYRTATDEVKDTFLLHTDARGSFITLILQPPQRVLPEQARPKEMIFVIDRSGSMSGFPIEKAKETMRLAIAQMNPRDTFNLLSFAGGTGRCFAKAVPNTLENRARALQYLADLYGSGGTQMMPAIMDALGGEHDPERVRIVAFMTDGYIGNDFAIIDAVRQHAGTSRVFAFGIGNAVNRFLLDGMAQAGRGAVEYVTLQSHGEGAAQRFHQRIHAPVLTDIAIDWGALPVTEVYPQQLPDLFSNTPIMIHARLTGPVHGTIVLRGHTGAGPFVRRIPVQGSTAPQQHEVLASLWARAKVEALMMQDYAALQQGTLPEERRQEITDLGVHYRLITQFTSFVAVEEMTVSAGGELVTIAVPVDLPAGVSYAGIFGPAVASASPPAPQAQHHQSAYSPARQTGVSPKLMLAAERQTADMAASQEVALPPEAKLADVLRALPEKAAAAGKNGNLRIGSLRVVDYKVDVMLYLRDTSKETLRLLERLGFVPTAESKAVRLLIGSIDVRQLDELATLDAVIRITPVVG